MKRNLLRKLFESFYERIVFCFRLTNEEVKENWEKYGNPDGPSAMTFGIALPKWIVEKENSLLVLGVYCFAFMVVLPTVVVNYQL